MKSSGTQKDFTGQHPKLQRTVAPQHVGLCPADHNEFASRI